MAGVAAGPELKIPREGRLAAHPLAALLGPLGLLRATGVLDVQKKKLVRRFVLRDGVLLAVVGNARQDRLAEWLLESGRLGGEAAERLAEALPEAGDAPLLAGWLLEQGFVSGEDLPGLVRDHLVALLRETASWGDATFRVVPGRLALGAEPTADLPALEAALLLAREEAERLKRPRLPEGVRRVTGPGELPLADPERALLEAAAEPVGLDRLAERTGTSEAGLARLLLTLLRVGLLVPAAPPEEEAGFDLDREMTDEELDRWLAAARTRDAHGLLGIRPGASPGAIRQAWYKAVRRFHPDRFRTGPFAGRRAEVEEAFRVLHEVYEELTDPAAAAARKRQVLAQEAHQPSAQAVAARWRERARKAALDGQRADAVDCLEKALEAHPDDVDAARDLCLLLLGNPARRQDALRRLAELAAKYPARADILAARAVGLLRTGKEREAELLLDRVERLDPSLPLLRALRGDPSARARVRENPFLAPVLPR